MIRASAGHGSEERPGRTFGNTGRQGHQRAVITLPVLRRRLADDVTERRAERTQRHTSHCETGVSHRCAMSQQHHRPLDAASHKICVRGLAVHGPEPAREVRWRHRSAHSQHRHTQPIPIVPIHEISRPSQQDKLVHVIRRHHPTVPAPGHLADIATEHDETDGNRALAGVAPRPGTEPVRPLDASRVDADRRCFLGGLRATSGVSRLSERGRSERSPEHAAEVIEGFVHVVRIGHRRDVHRGSRGRSEPERRSLPGSRPPAQPA